MLANVTVHMNVHAKIESFLPSMKQQCYIEHLQQTVLTEAKYMAPEVVLQGSAGPVAISVDFAEFAPMLDTRVQVELAASNRRREANAEFGAWSEWEGLYRNQGDDWHFEGVLGTHPPVIEERALTQDIDRLLLSRRISGEPVVALDFGGGLGLSWLRLAAQPKYRQAIKEGRLAMAVTNLGSIPNESIHDDYSGIAGHMNAINKRECANDDPPLYLPEDLEWAQENQDYVHYLDANTLDVGLQAVQLPDGTELSLMGNVGVIHEDQALMHAHTPDLAMANFRELLTKDGVLASNAATYYHSMHVVKSNRITLADGRIIPMNEAYSRQRRVGLVVGSTMLQQQGYSYRHDDERYAAIFRYEPHKDEPREPFQCGKILS